MVNNFYNKANTHPDVFLIAHGLFHLLTGPVWGSLSDGPMTDIDDVADACADHEGMYVAFQIADGMCTDITSDVRDVINGRG